MKKRNWISSWFIKNWLRKRLRRRRANYLAITPRFTVLQDRRAFPFRVAALAAGAAFLSQPAQADTAFTSFAFPPTGEPTSRTMPNRLAEIKNVKDFGAIGDGFAIDTTAIQAAVNNVTSTGNRGWIFFPPGTYLVDAAITYNGATGSQPVSILFTGCGDASTITGNFPGFIFDRSLSPSDNPTNGVKVFEKLVVSNGNAAGGGIRLGSSVGAVIRDCNVNAWRCIQFTDSDGGAVQSGLIENCVFSPNGQGGASCGISTSANVTIIACDLTGFHVGINLAGVGPEVHGCRFEVNRIGIRLGTDIDGTVTVNSGCNGFIISGGSFESNGRAIDFAGGSGFGIISGFQIIGFEGSAPYELLTAVPSTAATFSASAAGGGSISIDVNGIATITGITGGPLKPRYNLAGAQNAQPWDFVSGAVIPTATVLYQQLTGTTNGNGTYIMRGTPSYGIHTNGDACQFVVFSGISCGPQAYIAGISVGNTTSRNGLVFNGCNSTIASAFGGVAWQTPTNAWTAEFINCNTSPTYLFAGLPVAGNLRAGDSYFITDVNTSTLGANVTAGGGTTKGFVVWNGTAWTLMSK